LCSSGSFEPRGALSSLGRRTNQPPISWLMEVALRHPDLINLAAGFTDNATLPVAEVRALLGTLLGRRRTGEPALQYGNTPGLPELVQRSSERLRKLDGPEAGAEQLYAPDQFLITHGSQQLLYIVTEILCDPGDVVVVEDPTYFVYLGIAQSHGLDCRGVPLDPDGMDLAALDTTLGVLKRSGRLHRLKLIYLVSYYQNPTGTTTRFAKKVELVDLLRYYEHAAGHPIYLLEDAAYRELRFSGEEERSALAAPGAGPRVIYARTYSKPFATGMRGGFARLPSVLHTAAVRVKGNHDFGTSSLLQHVLNQALASGAYEQHLALLRRRYADKAAAMVKAMRRHFPSGVRWQEPRGGMYVWATLPEPWRSGLKSRLFRRARAENVLYVPGALCYADDVTRPRPDHEVRLTFGSVRARQITEGIARLARCLESLSGPRDSSLNT